MQGISIHALREEGDNKCGFCQVRKTEFLSTPSARRATTGIMANLYENIISIHALREEGDACGRVDVGKPIQFLSTPSARRATELTRCFDDVSVISIHALREEGDGASIILSHFAVDFYPRPPRGGRLSTNRSPAATRVFLSTPSARRATNPP